MLCDWVFLRLLRSLDHVNLRLGWPPLAEMSVVGQSNSSDFQVSQSIDSYEATKVPHLCVGKT